MKLMRGMIKTLHELTGYSEKYINQVAKGEIKTPTKARTKVEKAISIMEKQNGKAASMVIEEMAKIDLLYVRELSDLDCIPVDFLKRKFGTENRSEVFYKCEARGYY